MIAIAWTVAGVAIVYASYAMLVAGSQQERADRLQLRLTAEINHRRMLQAQFDEMSREAVAQRDEAVAQEWVSGRITGTLYRN